MVFEYDPNKSTESNRNIALILRMRAIHRFKVSTR
jgi:hypothetical protein